MGTISVSLPSDGTTIDAADVSTPITTIVNEINGGLDSANLEDAAVTTAKIADNSVTNAKLSTTTGELGGAWTTWAPTWTNLSVGNGTLVAKYTRVGKTVEARMHLTFGSTTSVSGSVDFTLPVTAVALDGSADIASIGNAVYYDGATNISFGRVQKRSTTQAMFHAIVASGTYLSQANLSSTIPFTWNTSDQLTAHFSYEAA